MNLLQSLMFWQPLDIRIKYPQYEERCTKPEMQKRIRRNIPNKIRIFFKVHLPAGPTEMMVAWHHDWIIIRWNTIITDFALQWNRNKRQKHDMRPVKNLKNQAQRAPTQPDLLQTGIWVGISHWKRHKSFLHLAYKSVQVQQGCLGLYRWPSCLAVILMKKGK